MSPPIPTSADKRVSLGGTAPGIARNAFGLRGAVSYLIETRGVGIGLQSYQRRVSTHYLLAKAVLEASARPIRTDLLHRLAAARRAAAADRSPLIVSHQAGERERRHAADRCRKRCAHADAGAADRQPRHPPGRSSRARARRLSRAAQQAEAVAERLGAERGRGARRRRRRAGSRSRPTSGASRHRRPQAAAKRSIPTSR